jgi:hypothetical protein
MASTIEQNRLNSPFTWTGGQIPIRSLSGGDSRSANPPEQAPRAGAESWGRRIWGLNAECGIGPGDRNTKASDPAMLQRQHNCEGVSVRAWVKRGAVSKEMAAWKREPGGSQLHLQATMRYACGSAAGVPEIL